jgi:hypothetical protein
MSVIKKYIFSRTIRINYTFDINHDNIIGTQYNRKKLIFIETLLPNYILYNILITNYYV